MKLKLAIGGVALALSLATGAHAAQIALAPSNVIGASGFYTACCAFQAGNIFDQQTGPVTETFGAGYWLNPDNGPTNAFITIDLGAVYDLSQVDLFNTHNGGYQDRGTGDFTIMGSNSVTDLGGGDFALVGGVVVASGTLAPEFNTATTITDQSFAATGSFRYLSFDPTSVSVGGAPCCGANVYGLDELRVSGVSGGAVPEPASWALMIGGFGMAGAMLRRRRAGLAAA
jgi:PEP-CTERM motif